MKILDSLTTRQKSFSLILMDTGISAASLALAFYLKFPSLQVWGIIDNYSSFFPLFILIRIIIYKWLGLYKFLWRYASVNEMMSGFKAITLGSIALTSISLVLEGVHFPFTVLIIDWLLNLAFIGGSRLMLRLYRDKRRKVTIKTPEQTAKKILIIGAGDAGEMVAREIIKQEPNYQIVGFIDDKRYKIGQFIHQIPILGAVKDIPAIAKKLGAEEAIIAIPSATGDTIRKIADRCKTAHLKTKVTPAISELIHTDNISLKQLREVQIEDLLGREIVEVDSTAISEYITGNHVLITGAGGSIGSELCRQILSLSPASLILVDHSEFKMYQIDWELAQLNKKNTPIIPCLLDIKTKDHLKKIIGLHKPNIVFHAAAYKHVPLMEKNPAIAIQNNIQGTQNLVTLCHEFHVERCVIISTDKAVNASNCMGATKRISEMVMQLAAQENNRTKFTAVRFGNVLGSDGSVVPLFKKQIQNGGPVTVTHPDVTRFFMAIIEAVRLVLQAGALSKGGEIFVLDMGKPIKIINLAQDMIRLSGLESEKDIQIEFTGLRPGEKLHEELFFNDEELLQTEFKKIRIAKTKTYKDPHHLRDQINSLIQLSYTEDAETLKSELLQLANQDSPVEAMQ